MNNLPIVSFYSRANNAKGNYTIDFNSLFDGIREGRWQDGVFKVRTAKTKEEKDELKRLLPSATISGLFENGRKIANLKKHSGYIVADIDKRPGTVNEDKEALANDPHCLAAFISCGGEGVCAIMKIEPNRHEDAFRGLQAYLWNTYKIPLDGGTGDVSRTRFVSFDPDIIINDNPKTFKQYLPKEKKKKLPKVAYIESDFDNIIRELSTKNICENYSDWVSIGFALISKFGEGARHYFHALSGSSSKYDARECDIKFDSLLRDHKNAPDKEATIATIYWYAKLHNIPFYSDQTKKIVNSAAILKKSGKDRNEIIKLLECIDGILPSDSAAIVDSTIEAKATPQTDNLIDGIQTWLKLNFDISRNIITRKIENNRNALEDIDFNTIFLECKKVFEDVNFELFTRIVFSRNIRHYNPFLDFFEANINHPYNNEIEAILGTINSDSADKLQHFGKKWLVSIISAIHGEHSPLMLVLAGEKQNTGKTEWFRRLLPTQLRQFYAESKLDMGKDDEILMCQKLLIMDDEMGGKSKKETKRLKELTSKQTFSLREPYGRANVDLVRLAVLCGTSNDLQLLNDPTGNRRIIPIEVHSVNQVAYNAIDKTALFMELYRLWKAGFEWRFDSDDIDKLGSGTQAFKEYTLEYELINKYFETPKTKWNIKYLTATDIKIFLEQRSNQKLSLKKIGEELKVIGFEKSGKKVNGVVKYVYSVHEISLTDPEPEIEDINIDEFPF